MPQDIQLTDDLDTIIVDGDFADAEATRDNQNILLVVDKGSLRGAPMRGVGIREWLLDEGTGDLNGAILREFEADGMTVTSINLSQGTLQIDATYE